ncbi:putative reverse transcriptase domain-containing protein [Tanacetum coccineum]
MPTPPPSPPSAGEHLDRCTALSAHSSPPHVPLPLLPSFRFTAALPSPPLPPLLPSLYIPPPIDRRDDIPKSERPPRKRSCLFALGPRETMRDREVRYGIRDTWVDPTEAVSEIAPMTVEEVNTRVIEIVELHEHDTHDLYALLEDAQDSRTHISQRVTMDSQRVDLLIEDRIDHQEIVLIVEEEAYASREAWAHAIGLSQAVHYELQTHREQFVANETKKVDKYINGLPDNIYGNVKSSRPKMLDETIELANDWMDQKLCTYAKRQTDNKRKDDDSSRNNHGHQQQPFKRQNVAKVYNMGSGEKKPYSGSLPKGTGNTNVANAQRDNMEVPKGNCYFECGAPGHFKRDCLKLKNKNGGSGNAQGWVYAVGNAEKNGNASRNPDSNVVTSTFLLNNRYASILFDTGADRSFISTALSSLIDIAPTLLENSYDVELADGKIVGIDTIIQGCTLNFLNHPFNIDLMPVELGSFDVIIGMDWLRRCHAVIVCDEKLV